MGLRKGQKELVEQYRGGYCAVPAIPGGGKTYCLSRWAVEIISQGLHKPGKVLIVTYMNSAANNFKQRISSMLQEKGILSNRDYFVSTIHGLCLQIIKEKPDVVITSDEFNVVDEVNKIHIISTAIDEWRRRNDDRFQYFADLEGRSTTDKFNVMKRWHERFQRVVLSAVSEFKCRGITPGEAMDICANLPGTSMLKCCAEIYEIYDRRLKIGGFLDFDDTLYKALQLLKEDEDLLRKYRRKYTFVCEDEAQDSNLIQTEILSLIAGDNFLRVGDSNQAICSTFTNSDPELFRDFCRLEKTVKYYITQSSRSSEDIIGLANYFVQYVREWHPVKKCRESLQPQFIEPVDEDDDMKNPVTPVYSIKASILNSWEEEVMEVVRTAEYFVREYPEKTIAVLVPSSWQIDDIIRILENRNVRFEYLDNTSDERNRPVRILGRVLDFIASPQDGKKLYDMLYECLLSSNASSRTDEISREYLDFIEKFFTGFSVEKLLYPTGGEIDLSQVPERVSQSVIWDTFCANADLIRGFLEFPRTVPEKLILYIAEKINFNREERAVAQKVAGDVRFIMEQNPRWRLSDLANELLSPRNMFNYFTGVVWELKGYEPKPGVVTVCTYHKAKGMEWDIVLLTGLNNADFPVYLNDRFIGEYWFLKQEYRNPEAVLKRELDMALKGTVSGNYLEEAKIETISEKARVLYVGITRAREYLFLSGYQSNMGRRNQVLPSRYLVELKRYIDRKRLERQKRN